MSMCLVSSSPPLRRSSFSSRTSSSSESTSTSSTSSGSTATRRVSFNAKVKVYDLEPLLTSERGTVFYSPSDYRRFRSDSCLEILDQQLQSQQTGRDPWSLLWQKILFWRFSANSPRKAHSSIFQGRPQDSRSPEIDYPWLTPYHPHEVEEQVEQARQQASAGSSRIDTEPSRTTIVAAPTIGEPTKLRLETPSKPSVQESSRESVLIQELAFWSLS